MASGPCVALFRGINVGTAKRISMSELRALIEGLGYAGVRTLLNSGNVVFTFPGKHGGDAALRIEAEVARRLGVKSRVTVLTGKEVAEAVADNPFASVADNPSRLLVFVPWDSKAQSELKPLLEKKWAPERIALGKRVAYLWCPEGIIDSPLWAAVNRVLGDRGTSRNIATMAKLHALCEGSQK